MDIIPSFLSSRNREQIKPDVSALDQPTRQTDSSEGASGVDFIQYAKNEKRKPLRLAMGSY